MNETRVKTSMAVQPESNEEAVSIIQELVTASLHDLSLEFPVNIRSQLKDVSFVVRLKLTDEEREITGGTLRAMFVGVPHGHPAMICFFAEMYFAPWLFLSEDNLRQQVRKDLLHEIGHYFGMNENQLQRMGY